MFPGGIVPPAPTVTLTPVSGVAPACTTIWNDSNSFRAAVRFVEEAPVVGTAGRTFTIEPTTLTVPAPTPGVAVAVGVGVAVAVGVGVGVRVGVVVAVAPSFAVAVGVPVGVRVGV